MFGHPLVEGHFWAKMGDAGLLGGGGGRGVIAPGCSPIATDTTRKMWRERGEEKRGVKEKEKKKKKKLKNKRMSEWRRWKPLPRYPTCTSVAQRASTWVADPGIVGAEMGRACAVVVQEPDDEEYEGEDEKEEAGNDDDDDEVEEEDLEDAIMGFLEMKIPVDLSSLYRLRTSFAGTGNHTMTADTEAGEAAGAEAGWEEDEEDMRKVKTLEGGQENQVPPLVQSWFFSDTDIEGFEFLFEEEDEGGGIWNSKKTLQDGERES